MALRTPYLWHMYFWANQNTSVLAIAYSTCKKSSCSLNVLLCTCLGPSMIGWTVHLLNGVPNLLIQFMGMSAVRHFDVFGLGSASHAFVLPQKKLCGELRRLRRLRRFTCIVLHNQTHQLMSVRIRMFKNMQFIAMATRRYRLYRQCTQLRESTENVTLLCVINCTRNCVYHSNMNAHPVWIVNNKQNRQERTWCHG